MLTVTFTGLNDSGQPTVRNFKLVSEPEHRVGSPKAGPTGAGSGWCQLSVAAACRVPAADSPGVGARAAVTGQSAAAV